MSTNRRATLVLLFEGWESHLLKCTGYVCFSLAPEAVIFFFLNHLYSDIIALTAGLLITLLV